MGEIRDAIETLTDMKAELGSVGIYSAKRSISSSAMDGTANFPVLVEDSINIDDAILISRAAEKKYASFLLTVLTMDPFLEVEKGETPSAQKYLKQFHQNIRVKNSDKLIPNINLIDALKESYDVDGPEYSVMESEVLKMTYAIYEGVSRSVPQDKNIALNYTIEDVTTEGTLNERFSTRLPMMEDNTYNYQVDTVELKTTGKGDKVTLNHADNYNEFHHTIKVDPNIDINVGSSKNPIDNIGKSTVRDRGVQWKPLTPNECKKSNDLVPTLLHIRVFPIDKYTREELSPIDFMIGVKATIHPIPLSEITRMVVMGMRNENFVFNFIRWTTGEIKFFKDFVFAIDTIKMDAKDAGRDVTGWRPALKRRRKLSKMKLRLSKNSVLPNTTLVISQSGIDYIKENYGYDLSDENIINRMMDTYFLLGFVYVNTVNQRATFKFDGIDYTDTYTFSTLKQETQNDDKAYKNLMKMLGRSM